MCDCAGKAVTKVGTLKKGMIGMARAAVAAGTGIGEVTPQTYRSRRAICKSCSSYDPKFGKCSECGCLTAAKALLTVESCPLEKW